MGTLEFTIMGVGVIIATLLFGLLLISKRKDHFNETQRLADEISRLGNVISIKETTIQTNLINLNEANNKINQLQNSEKETNFLLESKEKAIQKLSSTLIEIKENERRLSQTITLNELKISEMSKSLDYLKNENEKINGIITNHKNNIPNILKIRKDNSDTLFFYRELIHTIVYYNPIHNNIIKFQNSINNIDDNLKRKEIASKFGECLEKINFSNIDKQIEEFKEIIVNILFTPFNKVGEKDLGIHNVKMGSIFCKKVLESIDDILVSRQTELKTIGELYQILMGQYDNWRKKFSQNDFMIFLSNFIKGLKRGIINSEYGNELGDLLLSWEKGCNIGDNEFITLYNNTVQEFIKSSAKFTRNLDIDFTTIEILYQEYLEIENSSLQNKIQNLLTSGEDVLSFYSIWRSTQSNILLKGFPFLSRQIIDELKSKKLNESSIENIKDLVCTGCLN